MSAPVITLEPQREERSARGLTARGLAALLAAAGLPCVTVVADEAAAAAVPATPAEEGLRIVDGTLPVRAAYPIPPSGADGHHAALCRRDSHVLWLYDFTERHRWSAWREADDEWITVCPEPRPATYLSNGREVFRATGRPADEDLGSCVVVQVVADAGVWADAIEAEVAAELARLPKNRRFPTWMQQQRLDGAARTRAAGPGRAVDTVHRTEAAARSRAVGLQRNWPVPAVRYETALVTATAACITCFCPMICADGQWWHHTGRYPVECPGRRVRDLPLEPGDWEITSRTMTCGYCGRTVSWEETDRSWAQLTGFHSLGVHRETGELIVLAEVTGIAAHPGEVGHLPHHCDQIPDSVREQYAADIRAVTERDSAG